MPPTHTVTDARQPVAPDEKCQTHLASSSYPITDPGARPGRSWAVEASRAADTCVITARLCHVTRWRHALSLTRTSDRPVSSRPIVRQNCLKLLCHYAARHQGRDTWADLWADLWAVGSVQRDGMSGRLVYIAWPSVAHRNLLLAFFAAVGLLLISLPVEELLTRNIIEVGY